MSLTTVAGGCAVGDLALPSNLNVTRWHYSNRFEQGLNETRPFFGRQSPSLLFDLSERERHSHASVYCASALFHTAA